MKAARFHAKSDIRIETIPNPPPPGPTEVTIDVHWGGICGSDLHEYTVGPLVINTASRPHALTGCCLPLTLGHEFCGRVSKVPEGSKLQVGQAVMVDPRLNCRECLACRSGRDNVCEKWGFLGLNGGGGGGAGFSEKVNVASRMCYVLDESVDLNDAVLIEPLTVGRHALAATGMDDFSGLNVLVVGGGPVGVAVLYNLRAKGVGRLFVSEPTAKRSEMVRELGLASGDDVMNPLIVSVPEECRSRTEGKGVDVVFDCAGIPAGLKAGTDALRAGGTYMNVAGWELPMTIPMEYCMLKELTVKFSMAYDDKDFKDVVADFAAGKFAGAEKMITARIALDDIASKGFDELVTKKDDHVKIVVTPRAELLT